MPNVLKGERFTETCAAIRKMLGFVDAKQLHVPGLSVCHSASVVRNIPGGASPTVEAWLCVFLTEPSGLTIDPWEATLRAARTANARYVLVVVFGYVPQTVDTSLRSKLNDIGADLLLFYGDLAETLAKDVARVTPGFSFKRLRARALEDAQKAGWYDRYQPLTLLPGRRGGQASDPRGDDVDIIQAMKGGSFLLLGGPGSGKTEALKTLTAELARAGGYSPVYISLAQYRENLKQLLAQALSTGEAPLRESESQVILESGALIVMLDGLNEVEPSKQAQLIKEINEYTAPGSPTSLSRWIIAGRLYDYDYDMSHVRLTALDKQRWEIQPLSVELVYEYLEKVIDAKRIQRVVTRLKADTGLLEVCRLPLLVAIVGTIYERAQDALPVRPEIYRSFVESLLERDFVKGLGNHVRQELERLGHEALDVGKYRSLALQALRDLAQSMREPFLPFQEATQTIERRLNFADPVQASMVLLKDFVRRGLLRIDAHHRISFLHRTFQEYFNALNLQSVPVTKVIPDEGVALDKGVVRFVAAMTSSSATVFAERALEVRDPELAFNIVADAGLHAPRDLTLRLTRALVERVQEGRTVGEKLPWAQRVQSVAGLRGEDIPTLIQTAYPNAQDTERAVIRVLQELKDTQGQYEQFESRTRTGARKLPEDLYGEAVAALQEKDASRAIDLLNEFLQEEMPNSKRARALANRGIAYFDRGQQSASIADLRAAVALGDAAEHHANLSSVLRQAGRKDEARKHGQIAIDKVPEFSLGHAHLARALEPDDAVKALSHWEQAVRYAPHEEDRRRLLPQLLQLQEKLGRHEDAIRSLDELILLDPLSPNVREWKQARNSHNLALGRTARESTTSESERYDDPVQRLAKLARDWLREAGLEAIDDAPNRLLTRQRNTTEDVAIILLVDPSVNGPILQKACSIDPKVRNVVLLANSSECLLPEADVKLAELQHERRIGFLTAAEVHEAVCDGGAACSRLLSDVLSQARSKNPFRLKGVVKRVYDFFGRTAELKAFTKLIADGESFGLYGIHKIGKSSLLRRLRYKLAEEGVGVSVIHVELSDDMEVAGDFYRKLIDGIADMVPAAREIATGQDRPKAADLRRALETAYDHGTKKSSSHRLLLMLDEYPFLLPDGRNYYGLKGFKEILALLKTLIGENWFQFLPCGRSAALTRRGSFRIKIDDVNKPNNVEVENPFLDLIDAHFLQPLPREEHDEMMNRLATRAMPLTFSKEALETMYGATGGHPGFSRDLGVRILDQGGGKVDVPRVEKAIQTMLTDGDGTATPLAIYEKRMSDVEREIAFKLAMEGATSYEDLLPSDATSTTEELFSEAVSNLVSTTVLREMYPEGPRILSHRYGLLRKAIQQHATKPGT